MADFVYSDGTFMCQHGGIITVTPSKRDVQVERKNSRTKMVISNKIDTGGAYLIRRKDLEGAIVQGCTHMANGIPDPCTIITTTEESTVENINHGTLLIAPDIIDANPITLSGVTVKTIAGGMFKVKYIPKVGEITKSATTNSAENRVNIKAFRSKEIKKALDNIIVNSSDITPNSSEADIKSLQLALISVGYPLNPDGEYGPSVCYAIYSFVKRYNAKEFGLNSYAQTSLTLKEETIGSKIYLATYEIREAIKEVKKHSTVLSNVDFAELEKSEGSNTNTVDFFIPLNTCKSLYIKKSDHTAYTNYINKVKDLKNDNVGSNYKELPTKLVSKSSKIYKKNPNDYEQLKTTEYCPYCSGHNKTDPVTHKVTNTVEANDFRCENATATGVSGVTVATGLDIGQKGTEEFSTIVNFAQYDLLITYTCSDANSMKNQLTPYIGKKHDDAVNALRAAYGYYRKWESPNNDTTNSSDNKKRLEGDMPKRMVNSYLHYDILHKLWKNYNKVYEDCTLEHLKSELISAMASYHHVRGGNKPISYIGNNNGSFKPQDFEAFAVSLCLKPYTKKENVILGDGITKIDIHSIPLDKNRRDIMANLLYNGIIKQWKNWKRDNNNHAIPYKPKALLEYDKNKDDPNDSKVIIKVEK